MSCKNIFLIILDSVRKDCLLNTTKINLISELKEDFVYYKNCSSIYTNTFLSHYVLFFGDYLYKAKNRSFPAQLKNLGFNNFSLCNYAVLMGYPYNNNQDENTHKISIFEMIKDLGIQTKFDLKKKNFGKKVEDYYGAADDKKNKMPEKWKNYLKNMNSDKSFMYLHFWSTHHNYDIDDFLETKISGKNYKELGQNLVQKILKKEISECFLKKIYNKKILEVINTHIKDFIEILKQKGIYNDSLIFITADHGEGLGDIGYSAPKTFFFFYKIVKRLYFKVKREIFPKLPDLKKIFYCKWDNHIYFHNGEYEFQKEIPLLVKFPNQVFGGINYYKKVSLFDIIHTINDSVDDSLLINNKLGCSLYYLLKQGKNAREKYKLDSLIKKKKLYIHSK